MPMSHSLLKSLPEAIIYLPFESETVLFASERMNKVWLCLECKIQSNQIGKGLHFKFYAVGTNLVLFMNTILHFTIDYIQV